MSLEAAKKVLTEVNREVFKGKSEKEIELFLKENGYDCSIEELKKAYILAETLSEDEMEKVTGGKGNGCPHAAKKGSGMLGYAMDVCTGDYYVESCSDTVEEGSSCWSGDRACVFSGREYTIHCSSDLKETQYPNNCFGIT